MSQGGRGKVSRLWNGAAGWPKDVRETMGGAQRTFAKKLLGTLTLLLAFAQFGMSEPIPLSTALDAAELTFTTGGDADWFGQTATTYDGVDAARSGAIGHSQTSYMETTVSGPGTLSFWWKVSC